MINEDQICLISTLLLKINSLQRVSCFSNLVCMDQSSTANHPLVEPCRSKSSAQAFPKTSAEVRDGNTELPQQSELRWSRLDNHAIKAFDHVALSQILASLSKFYLKGLSALSWRPIRFPLEKRAGLLYCSKFRVNTWDWSLSTSSKI